jgi:hypothetical protein
MADNYLEKRREAYEERKAEWLNKRKHLPKGSRLPQRPEDESL